MTHTTKTQKYCKSFFMLRALLLFVLGLSFYSCSATPPEPEIIDISELIEAGQWEEATTQIQAVLAEFPQNVDALYNLAALLYQQDKIDEAWQQAMKAKQLAPQDDDVNLLLIKLSLATNNVQQAWNYFTQLSEESKMNANTQYLLGNIQAKMRNWAQAANAYLASLELGIPEAKGKASLAFVLLQDDRTEEARNLLREARSLKNISEETYRQIAECLLLMGDGLEAKQIAYSLDPENRMDAGLWSLIGRAELLLLNYGEAESAFTRALASPDSSPKNNVEYAIMLFAAQREDEALRQAMEAEEKINALDISVHDPALYNLLATLFARRGQWLLSQQYLNMSLNLNPAQPAIREKLSFITNQIDPNNEPSAYSGTSGQSPNLATDQVEANSASSGFSGASQGDPANPQEEQSQQNESP